MTGAGIKRRAPPNSPYTATATPCENRPDDENLRIDSGIGGSTSSVFGSKEATVGSICRKNMRDPGMLRTLRIGCVLVLVLYVWSSSGDMVATVEIDTKGAVHKVNGSILQQDHPARQMTQTHQHRHQNRLRQPSDEEKQEHPQENAPSAVPTKATKTTPSSSECGLYLAPSTIPGAGLGMFSAYPRSKGETVGNEEVVLPLVEVSFYNGQQEDLFNPFIHYYWKGKEKALHGIVSEDRAGEVMAVVPGMEAAINCNLALINVEMSGSEYDDSNLERYKDPMTGGMSPYHSTSSRVSRDIPAGGELFKFYGDRWFAARQESFGLIPLSENYPAAQQLVDKYDELQRKLFPEHKDLQDDLWSLIKDTIGKEMWESRTMNALPANITDVKKAADSEIASLHQPHAIRSLEYLREHGKCVDSIRQGPSTLESHQGGRGAFATRSMTKGAIITGSPLNHVPKKDLITIFKMEQNYTAKEKGEDVWLRHVDKIVGYQMSLNYCYGHNSSTMLLCPYGAGVNYINHNQTRANVKVQWAQDGMTSHNSTWLYTKRVEDLEWDYSIGLAFDYVATTDIQENDELFLDYGDDFEEALTHYLSTWKSAPSKDDYVPAQRYNKQIADSPIRTETEQKEEPYPRNLELRCHSELVTKRNFNGAYQPGSHWESREFGVPCRILERYVVGTSEQDDPSKAPLNESVYKVELTVPLDEVGLQRRSDVFTYIQRKDVTRSAIRFFNRPYTTDLFLPNAFRKEIGIPDSMFPGQWRNSVPKNPHEEFRQLLFGDSKV